MARSNSVGRAESARRAARARKLRAAKHREALLKANKRFDAFERALLAFYRLIYDDVNGNRQAFLLAAQRAQRTLRNGDLPNARINDSPKEIEKWFDRIERSSRR